MRLKKTSQKLPGTNQFPKLSNQRKPAILSGILCAVLGLSLQSCHNSIDYGEIPWEDVYVNFTVNLSLGDENGPNNILASIGNWKVFENEGVWGVFVYHLGDMEEEYVAYDLACPFDCMSSDCTVSYDATNACFVSKCGQKFSIFSGFCTTISGYSLYKYHITYLSNGSFVVSNQ